MTGWQHQVCDANDLLLDRLIVDCDGQPVGMVDDLELTEPGAGGAPVITAILCGPTALGPRLGGRLGTWWLAIGRRLRPLGDPYPVRIPFDDVTAVDRRQLTVRRPGAANGTWLLREWVYEKLVSRIPGGAR
jgi:sporulation protein YlmC with PRC-barrel domain